VSGRDQFICEPIDPVAGSAKIGSVSVGEPGLPGGFHWRGREYRVVGVLRKWKSSGPCRHGSGERYLRRHWYRVRTADGSEMTLYFDRQAKDRKHPRRRWFIYTVSPPPAGDIP